MEKEVITTLERHSSFLRTLSVWVDKSKTYYSLCAIHFYNKKGDVIVQDYGYFDNDEILSFKGNVVRKIKVDFSKKENFVIKSKKSYNFDNDYELYIYVNNVDFKYVGLKKEYECVFRVYTVNGIEVKQNIKFLKNRFWEIENLLKNEKAKIEDYKLPLKQEEIEEICNNIVKYNQMLIEENKKIKEYVPKEEDFIEG